MVFKQQQQQQQQQTDDDEDDGDDDGKLFQQQRYDRGDRDADRSSIEGVSIVRISGRTRGDRRRDISSKPGKERGGVLKRISSFTGRL